MAKALEIDPSHHAVQLVQRVDFICVVCKKCSCHDGDRLEKECRTDTFLQQQRLAPLDGATGPVINH